MKHSRLVLGLYDATRERVRPHHASPAARPFALVGPLWLPGPGDRRGGSRANPGRRPRRWDTSIACCWRPGTLFDENWYPAHWGRRDVHASLNEFMNDGDFLAAGRHTRRARPGRMRSMTAASWSTSSVIRCAGGRQLAWRPPGPDRAGSRRPRARRRPVALVDVRCRGGAGATFRAFDPATAAAIVDLVSPQGDAAPVAPYLAPGNREVHRGQRVRPRRLSSDRAAPAAGQGPQPGRRRETRRLSLEPRILRRCRPSARRAHVSACRPCTASRPGSSLIAS